MAAQTVNLRYFVDNNDDDDFSESDSDRELFIALTQFLFEYGHSRGYY